jgi:hypothetical protein
VTHQEGLDRGIHDWSLLFALHVSEPRRLEAGVGILLLACLSRSPLCQCVFKLCLSIFLSEMRVIEAMIEPGP